jgi:hypothetical protein
MTDWPQQIDPLESTLHYRELCGTLKRRDGYHASPSMPSPMESCAMVAKCDHSGIQ